MGGTQRELDEVNSKSRFDQASRSIKTKESHQKEEESPDKLAGGGCNVSSGRGWETPTKRLRDQSLSNRLGGRAGTPLPRTRRHCDWVAGWKRCELN